jgi:hypothetical protein
MLSLFFYVTDNHGLVYEFFLMSREVEEWSRVKTLAEASV